MGRKEINIHVYITGKYQIYLTSLMNSQIERILRANLTVYVKASTNKYIDIFGYARVLFLFCDHIFYIKQERFVQNS